MVGKWLCRRGVHRWILCRFWPHRFCRRCGMLQAWRLPGRKSWTTIGEVLAKAGAFDETTRDKFDRMYLDYMQAGAMVQNNN